MRLSLCPRQGCYKEPPAARACPAPLHRRRERLVDALVIVMGAMTRAADRPRSRRVLRLIALERIARGVHPAILHASELRIAAIVALGYGALELVEGTGLWLDQLWAEYLTVIATSLLLPFELYELVRRPSVWKAAGIIVNFAIVGYLAYLLRRRVRRSRPLEPTATRERLDELSR